MRTFLKEFPITMGDSGGYSIQKEVEHINLYAQANNLVIKSIVREGLYFLVIFRRKYFGLF